MRDPLDLSKARILCSNDDGVHARGLKLLADVARGLSDDVWVCAPADQQSGAGHSLSLHLPVRLRQHDERRWSVTGTPTDSVAVGMAQVLSDKKPDLVLSGINHGENLADDVTYSGTIAAAMEASILDTRAIALSMETHGAAAENVHWETAEHFAPEVIRLIVSIPFDEKTLVSVNFPNRPVEEVKGIRIVPHGRRKVGDQMEERFDPFGRPYYWIGLVREKPDPAPGTDLEAIAQGWISVTPLSLNLSHQPSIERLQAALDADS